MLRGFFINFHVLEILLTIINKQMTRIIIYFISLQNTRKKINGKNIFTTDCFSLDFTVTQSKSYLDTAFYQHLFQNIAIWRIPGVLYYHKKTANYKQNEKIVMNNT